MTGILQSARASSQFPLTLDHSPAPIMPGQRSYGSLGGGSLGGGSWCGGSLGSGSLGGGSWCGGSWCGGSLGGGSWCGGSLGGGLLGGWALRGGSIWTETPQARSEKKKRAHSSNMSQRLCLIKPPYLVPDSKQARRTGAVGWQEPGLPGRPLPQPSDPVLAPLLRTASCSTGQF
jgi:hypothetical protein